tara:strand:+ start:408 stop:1031 length:624 start_codon:yes stop_codon:yes gene_type:complete
MDVYGKNPKQNKPMSEFPVYYKYKMMEGKDFDDEADNWNGFKQKWKELDADEKLKEQYHKEWDEYEEINVGYYFRNNCWWWRPLWNYCYHVAPDIIDDDLFDSGHSNSGRGLDDGDSKLLGERLLKEIESGNTTKYQAEYQQHLDDLPDDNCMRCNNNNHGDYKKKECKHCNKTGKSKNFNKHYPFDVDNVKKFAHFCMECGGFEIN